VTGRRRAGPALRAAAFLLLVSVVTAVRAPPVGAQLHVGLQAGFDLSTFGGSFADDADPALGGSFGLDGEYWFGSRWVIDVDAGIAQRGAMGLQVGDDAVDYRLNYLEIPVTVGRALPILDGRWQLSPYVGASIGRVLACGVRFEGQSKYGSCDDASLGGAASGFDVGIPVGVALRHRYPGGSRWSLDLRYTHSLTSVLTPGEAAARHRLIQVLIGFVLPLTEQDR